MNLHATETRAALLEAGLHCFSRHGFDGTSIRMIAKRSGKPISLIGHHFGSKEGLYIEVFQLLFSLTPFKRSQARTELESAPRTRLEAIRNLREHIHLMFMDLCSPNDDQEEIRESGRRLWLMELRAPNPEILILFKEHLSPWVENVSACIRFLHPELSEVDVAFMGRIILGLLAGQSLTQGISDAVWGTLRQSPFKEAEIITDFVLLGMAVDCRQGRNPDDL